MATTSLGHTTGGTATVSGALGDQGKELLKKACDFMEEVMPRLSAAFSVTELRAGTREVAELSSNTELLILLGNQPPGEGEFGNFIEACQKCGLALDLYKLYKKRPEIFRTPLTLPPILEYCGEIYIASDSTLKTRAKNTKA